MFTTSTLDYDSLRGELIFNYTSTSKQDIVISICDADSDDLYGVKKFYSTTTAQINVAPLVRQHAMPQISDLGTTDESGFIEPQGCGVVAIILRDEDGEESVDRLFTLSDSSEAQMGVVSTMPLSGRAISIGERESILLRATHTAILEAEVRQYAYGIDEPVGTHTYYMDEAWQGVARFELLAEYLSEQYDVLLEPSMERIEVVFSQAGSELATVEYVVIDPPQESLRMAWLSSRGSVEHYTFPVILAHEVVNDTGERYTLQSAYELYDVRSALAEIAHSDSIWLIIDGEYRAATIQSDVVEVGKRGDMSRVQIKMEVA